MTIDVRQPELTDAEIADVVDGMMGLMVHSTCAVMGGAGPFIGESLGDTVSESTKLRVLEAFNRRADEMRQKAESLKV